MNFTKLNFGTAGFSGVKLDIPKNSKNPTADAISSIFKRGLETLEIEFVRSIYLKNSSKEKLNEIKKNSKKYNFPLSIHAPYFINLNAVEEHKLVNSRRYILDSLNIGQKIDARLIVVHIGYFLKQEPKLVLENITKRLEIIKDNYRGKVKLGIELTGKKTQVGSLDELFYFYNKFPNFIRPVIDFAHQHARENGYFLQEKNINSFFDKFKSYPELLNDIHIHMSGIEYTDKGERRHLTLEQSNFPYKRILEKLKDNKAKGTVICESPDTVKDALLLKKVYEEL